MLVAAKPVSQHLVGGTDDEEGLRVNLLHGAVRRPQQAVGAADPVKGILALRVLPGVVDQDQRHVVDVGKFLEGADLLIVALVSVCILALALLLTACGPAPSDSAVSTGDSASGDHAFDYGGDVTLRILSGSENQELETILEEFAKAEGIRIEMTYQGSLDIMRALEEESFSYDAVWPASSLWLDAADTPLNLKHAESVSITPVVFGIREGLARELGLVGKETTVSDLLRPIQ